MYSLEYVCFFHQFTVLVTYSLLTPAFLFLQIPNAECGETSGDILVWPPKWGNTRFMTVNINGDLYGVVNSVQDWLEACGYKPNDFQKIICKPFADERRTITLDAYIAIQEGVFCFNIVRFPYFT